MDAGAERMLEAFIELLATIAKEEHACGAELSLIEDGSAVDKLLCLFHGQLGTRCVSNP
jgi:hypothetical protein